jgi:hypothetical protein
VLGGYGYYFFHLRCVPRMNRPREGLQQHRVIETGRSHYSSHRVYLCLYSINSISLLVLYIDWKIVTHFHHDSSYACGLAIESFSLTIGGPLTDKLALPMMMSPASSSLIAFNLAYSRYIKVYNNYLLGLQWGHCSVASS